MSNNVNNTIETEWSPSCSNKIKVVVFAPGPQELSIRLQRVLGLLIPKKNTEIFRTIERLSLRLRQPGERPTIAVLLAASSKDLADIISIRDLLGDTRTILILPDREEDTIATGHTLRPRFVSYRDRDFRDVAAVLGKMLGRDLDNRLYGQDKKGNRNGGARN